MYVFGLYRSYWRIGLVTILFLGVFFWYYSRQPRSFTFYFTQFFQQNSTDRIIYRGRLVVLLSMVVIVGVLLMRPQKVTTTTVNNEGVDIVLALDVSYSMEADDMDPSRMVVAREVLTQFVGALETDRVGVVVFAGKPFVSVPLTFDYGLAASVLERTVTETIDQQQPGLQGTAIGDALLSSITLLQQGRADIPDGDEREQVIILLTDGAANTGLDPLLVGGLAQEESIKIYTIGVGTPEGGSIPVSSGFGTRRVSVGGIDEPTLRSLASATGGEYRRATNAQTFQQIFDQIAQLEKTTLESDQVRAGREVGGWLAWVVIFGGVLLLLGEILFRRFDADQGEFWMLIALIVSGLVIVRNPGPSYDTNNRADSAVMIMLDLSTSMYVEDIRDGSSYSNRLDAAKVLIANFINADPAVQLGLGVFAGEAVGVVPITNTTQTVLSVLGSLDAGVLSVPGSAIGEAVRVGVERFEFTDSTQQTMLVVITDGGDDQISLDNQTRALLRDYNTELVIISVGTTEGGPIPVGNDGFGNKTYRTFEGETVISAVNDSGVRQLVDQVGGTALLMDNLDQSNMLHQLVRADGAKRTAQSGLIKRVLYWFQYILLLVYLALQTAQGSVFVSALRRRVQSIFLRDLPARRDEE